MPLTLRPGISFCKAGGIFVFLDIGSNRYFALPADANRHFGDWLADGDGLSRFTQMPCSQHILMPCAAGARRPVPVHVAVPSATYSDIGWPPALHICRAILEVERARLLVRRRTLGHIGQKIVQWRDAGNVAGWGALSPDDTFRALLHAGRIRSLQDACLAKSVAAMRMLGRHGSLAKMVLGVRMHPFAAHCWVQTEQMLVTDSPDQVESFTPILVI